MIVRLDSGSSVFVCNVLFCSILFCFFFLFSSLNFSMYRVIDLVAVRDEFKWVLSVSYYELGLGFKFEILFLSGSG